MRAFLAELTDPERSDLYRNAGFSVQNQPRGSALFVTLDTNLDTILDRRLSRATVAQQMIRGTLPSVYIGRRRLVLASVIRDLLNRRAVPKGSES